MTERRWFDPRSWFSEKASAAGFVVSSHYVGQPIWTPREYDRLATESYTLNAVAFRCVKMISQGAALCPWTLMDNSRNRVEEHALLDLLARPNPMNGGGSFFEAVYAYELLAGNTYVEATGTPTRPPKELWTLRPDRMKVVPGRYGVPVRYVYEHDGLKKEWIVSQMTGRSPEILHVKDFHPVNDWYGLSRVEPGAKGVDRNNAAGAHNMALLQNGARPSGALVYEAIKGSDGGELLPDPQVISKAKDRLRETLGGPAKAGEPLVLAGNVRWEEMAITPKDMDFSEAKADAARDICAAFGVPHVLIVPGDATYNNVREAKLELYEETVLPLAEHLTDELNHWLTPRFSDSLRLELDYDAITALEPRREIRRESVQQLLAAGVIHRDEAREELGFGDLPENAVMTVDPGTVTALQRVAEAVGPDPLIRYLKSVGLLDPNMTTAEAAAAAMAIDPYEDEIDPEDDEAGDDGAPQPEEGAQDAA